MKYHELFKLDHEVAVVTGAAGILGTEFCRALCDAGASVACIDTNKAALISFAQDLKAQYGEHRAEGFICNVANPDEVNQVIHEIIKRFNKIDILLNNAATKTNDLNAFLAPLEKYSLNVWREVMSVNLDGMFLMAQAIGNHMIPRKKGCILQTASIYSLMAPDHRIYEGSVYLGQTMSAPAVYTASKAGVIGLTKHLSTLWAEHGIRVNALCPGGVSSGQNDEFYRRYSDRIPMRRMAQTIDIAGPMLFLVSPAANYITGQTMFVDGGLSAW